MVYSSWDCGLFAVGTVCVTQIIFIEHVDCTSACSHLQLTAGNTGPLFADYSLWRYIETLRNRELVLADLPGP